MASGVLSRRGYVGLHVETSSSSGGGLRIRSVAAGSSAERAGLCAGDVLTHLDHNPVTDVFELRHLLRALRAGDPLVVDAIREGHPISFATEVMPFPLEQYAGPCVAGAAHSGGLPGARVELGQVDVGPHWLRSVAVVPDAGSLEGRAWGGLPPGRFPVIYFLPGAHWASEEYPLSPEHPVPALLGALARAGYASVRVERSGVGDSQGPPPDRVDFETELDGYRAGLRFILERDWAAPGCIFAFGHSLGAMVAPLLAHGEPGSIAGIACYAASALRISEGLVGAAVRHAQRSTHLEPALLARAEQVAELIRLVCEGQTPSAVFSRRPDLAAIAPSHFFGDQAYGRIASFYHQLERADIATAWRHLGLPALLMHGGRDWISAAEASTRIAALVGPTAAVVTLPGVDHHMSTEPEGARPRLALSVAEALVGWLDERTHWAMGSTTISQRP